LFVRPEDVGMMSLSSMALEIGLMRFDGMKLHAAKAGSVAARPGARFGQF
jgi:hypothetical protein